MPFPNEAMNTPGSGDPLLLDSVVGVACDSRGIVWMLDNGRRSGSAAKLVAWDKRNEHLKSSSSTPSPSPPGRSSPISPSIRSVRPSTSPIPPMAFPRRSSS